MILTVAACVVAFWLGSGFCWFDFDRDVDPAARLWRAAAWLPARLRLGERVFFMCLGLAMGFALWLIVLAGRSLWLAAL